MSLLPVAGHAGRTGGKIGYLRILHRPRQYVAYNAAQILLRGIEPAQVRRPADVLGTRRVRLQTTDSRTSAETAGRPVPSQPQPRPPHLASELSEKISAQTDAWVSGDAKDEAKLRIETIDSPASIQEGGKQSESTALEQPKKEDPKPTLWQKFKREVAHYRDGTKLLGKEISISSKLALKMGAGHELSRRERRQLERTIQDLARLVPFSMFVIIPFAEFLLPVVLKLFPNMLPSTYEEAASKEAKKKKLAQTRKSVSEFLRQTIRESGLPLSKRTLQREELVEFMRKVRTSGEEPSKEEVIKVCNIFRDDLTLDNLSRPQLVGMCRYLSLNTFGTDNMLRYNIRHRMRKIKRDDKAIAYEGVDSLSVTELQQACAARGIRTTAVSPAHLRDELTGWLDLRLKHGIPSTLLLLSTAFTYGQLEGPDQTYEALRATLSSLPDVLFHEAELEVSDAEGAATNRQRLEVLEEQQELIEEENEADKTWTGRIKDDKVRLDSE